MNIFKIIVVILLISSLQACSQIVVNKDYTKPIEHALFTRILAQIVAPDGMVNYQKLASMEVDFNDYLDHLSQSPPGNNWTTQQQLAYWINAYNAFTLKLILDNYPLESIKDIGSKIQIPFVNSPWDIKFIEIGNEMLTLNDIEHRILRKQFDEPRIHFVINCASFSCPLLRNEAYEPDNLEKQLQEQTLQFLNDRLRNDLTNPNHIRISKIFQWFSSDFTKDSSLISNLAKWSKQEINPKAKVSYIEYEWMLNDAK